MGEEGSTFFFSGGHDLHHSFRNIIVSQTSNDDVIRNLLQLDAHLVVTPFVHRMLIFSFKIYSFCCGENKLAVFYTADNYFTYSFWQSVNNLSE